MKKLFVQNSDGTFEELSALAIGLGVKDIKKTSIKDAFAKYIKLCTANKCKKNQYSEKLYFYRLSDFLISMKIEYIHEVGRDHIDQFESLLLSSMKVSSVNRRFNTIKHFFKKCLEWNVTYIDPCLGKKKRREEANHIKPWTKEVFDKFISKTDGVYKKIFHFLWLTGCRPMELKNLKWTDIDYDEKVIVFRCGKNAQVSRKFPIAVEVDKFLHNLKFDSNYVFTDNKTQINNDLLYHYCKTRLLELGLNNFTVYGIRHGFGTKLAKAGVSAFYIAELMGHAKLETTKRYIHSEKKQLIDILSKVK
jgi:integrase